MERSTIIGLVLAALVTTSVISVAFRGKDPALDRARTDGVQSFTQTGVCGNTMQT